MSGGDLGVVGHDVAKASLSILTQKRILFSWDEGAESEFIHVLKQRTLSRFWEVTIQLYRINELYKRG